MMLHHPSRFFVAAVFSVLFLAGELFTGAEGADWKSQWDQTLKEAKKEGSVELYGGYNPRYRKLNAEFEKKYPDIKIHYTPGGGAQHAIRILSEQRAKKYLVDIVMGGKTAFVSYLRDVFEPMRPMLILPEVSDASAWWGGRLQFFDPEEKYVFSATAYVSPAIAINTKKVHPEEIRSVQDLLNPKWKGKILQYYGADPALTTVVLFIYHTPSLGPQFLARLYRESNITFTRNLRQGVNWLAEGRYSIYIGGTTSSIYQARQKGLPVENLTQPLKEGEIMDGGYCCMGVLKNPPHPNASKVFINWLLSREGQATWQSLPGYPIASLRRDVSKEGLPPEMVPTEGKRYFLVNDRKNFMPEDMEAIRKIARIAAKGSKP